MPDRLIPDPSLPTVSTSAFAAQLRAGGYDGDVNAQLVTAVACEACGRTLQLPPGKLLPVGDVDRFMVAHYELAHPDVALNCYGQGKTTLGGQAGQNGGHGPEAEAAAGPAPADRGGRGQLAGPDRRRAGGTDR